MDKNKIIEKYTPLIWKIARQYNQRCEGFEIEDLFQEGCIEIFNACEKYNEEKGTELNFYANVLAKRFSMIAQSKGRVVQPTQWAFRKVSEGDLRHRRELLEGSEHIPQPEGSKNASRAKKTAWNKNEVFGFKSYTDITELSDVLSYYDDDIDDNIVASEIISNMSYYLSDTELDIITSRFGLCRDTENRSEFLKRSSIKNSHYNLLLHEAFRKIAKNL